MDDFFEPEQLSFTTPVERIDRPTASSWDCTTKFTLATKGKRGSDKREYGGHDGKILAQIRSDDSLNYATVCKVAQISSNLRKEGDETDPSCIKDAATEEPDSGTVGSALVNDKSVWEVKATTINAPRKEKPTIQKGIRPRTRDREVLKPPLGMRYSLAPSAGQRMSETSIYNVFLESYLDAFATVTPPANRSPDCLRVVAEVRHLSPIIYNVFLSVSATYFGSSIGDSRIVFAAQKLYVNVLRVLQNALLSPSQCKSLSTLLTVFLAVHYELLQNTSEKSLINHMMGALKLIEFRGPQSHISGLEHLCFVSYRNYLITTAIACRSPTFLAKEEWKTIPWSISPKDFVQYLLDVLADIPTLLANYDGLKAATKANSISHSQILDWRTMIQASVADIECRLHKWKIKHADQIGGPLESSDQAEGSQLPLAADTKLPVFRCQDLLNGQLISPPAITYPEPELARALCLYYGALLTISFVDMRTEGKLRPYERYSLACMICRSTEYFMRVVPNHSTRVLGSLRVAYDALPEGGVERQWVQDMFQLVGKAEHMKATASLAKDFSVQANASQ